MIEAVSIKSSPNFASVSFRGHDDFPVHGLHSFVIENPEFAYPTLLTRIGAVLADLVSPVLWHNDFEHALEQLHLEFMITLGGGGETGGRVYFDEPGLTVRVEQHIKAVHLKAVLVIDDH